MPKKAHKKTNGLPSSRAGNGGFSAVYISDDSSVDSKASNKNSSTLSLNMETNENTKDNPQAASPELVKTEPLTTEIISPPTSITIPIPPKSGNFFGACPLANWPK